MDKELKEISTAELEKELARRQPPAKKPGAGKAFSVKDTLKGKTILIIGGTGFLGRVTLYKLLKFTPDIKQVVLVVRKTHGQSGYDRFEREILNNPIFTQNPGDREYFHEVGPKKVRVVEGDGSQEFLGLNKKDLDYVRKNVDVFINTAGNVEFNPPVDASLNANLYTTINCLELIKTAQSKKYVHVSTCYVADRTVHQNVVPETPVAANIRGPEGVEIKLNVEQELKDVLKDIEDVRKQYESDAKLGEYIEEAREQVVKMGKDPDNRRVVEKIAKSLRTLEEREELIKLGRCWAQRINRPNVYTYTKTMAEILVGQYEGEVETTIVRPSVVESALQHPFSGWNEGIQGSVAILFLINQGHRMIPAIEDQGSNLYDTYLDVIPVDMVAAGMILSVCAIIRSEHKPVYQLSAGPINPKLTITRMVEMAQLLYRQEYNELSPVKRFVRKNLQSMTVKKSTYDRFSSPRMFKFLEKAKDRLSKFQPSEGTMLHNAVENAKSSPDTFYNLSLMKNKIFEEFLPFINGGYPVFSNDETRRLYERLPVAERQLYFFDPIGLDYGEYFETVHMPGIQKWVFPVMQKRIDAVLKASQNKSTERMKFFPRFRELLSLNDLEGLLTGGAGGLAKIVSLRGDKTKTDVKYDSRFWIERDAAMIVGKDYLVNARLERDYGYNDADFEKLSQHILMVAGVYLSPETIKEAKVVNNLRSAYDKKAKIENPDPYFGQRFLDEKHREGIQVPPKLAKPVRYQLYKLQMWFFRKLMTVRIAGKKNIPYNTNHVMVIANHSSHLDYGVIQYSLGRWGQDMGILAARDYFFNSFWSNTFFSNFMTLVPMDRETGSTQESLEPAFEFLGHGGPILIFPEGTRSLDGTLQEFKHGIGYLVRKSQCDVLPIHVSGTHDALPKGRTFPKRKKDIRVRIGKIIHYHDIEKDVEGMSPTKASRHISDMLKAKVMDPKDSGDFEV